MRVDDSIRKTIVFVGIGNEGSFKAYGTGFIAANVIGESVFQTIVTARHVIDRIPGKEVHVRVNTLEGRSEVRTAPKSDWLGHPDKKVDVAVCSSGFASDYYDVLHLLVSEGGHVLTPSVIDTEKLGIGNEVLISGMFVSHMGEAKNLPILRIGTIAAMPEEKLETVYGYHDAYLVEVRSIDGLSGSPAFVRPPIWDYAVDGEGKVAPKMRHGPPEYLMGMLLGTNEVYDDADFVELVKSPKEAEGQPPRVRVPLNTGIGIVLPISYVIEAIEQPELHERRMQAEEERKKERRYRPSAASAKSEQSTKTDNPLHKEDFNRLLDAAVQKPKQDNGT